MNEVAWAALEWAEGGCSVFPVGPNKRPMFSWTPYMSRRAEAGEVQRWWRQNPGAGIGIVCGAVSGALEMTEIEGRAADGDHMDRIERAMAEVGAAELWGEITSRGGHFVEVTPSGGIHIIYRISDHEVPGNTKIATRPETDDERVERLRKNPTSSTKKIAMTLAETRGEGGFVIVAPSGGDVHPTGDSWTRISGDYGVPLHLTWAERNLLHEGLRRALHEEMPESTAIPDRPRPQAPATGTRPGEEWAARTDWMDILGPHGWTVHSHRGEETMLTRPGKDRRDGLSATINYGGSDTLKIFSSNCYPFEAERTYSKFGAYALLEHNGDFAAATRALADRGFGEPLKSPELQGLDWPFPDEVIDESAKPAVRIEEFTEQGMGDYLAAKHADEHCYVPELKSWMSYRDGVWREDAEGRAVRGAAQRANKALKRLTDWQFEQADKAYKESGTEDSKEELATAKANRAFYKKMATDRSIRGMVNIAADQMLVHDEDLDPNKSLLALNNGVFNLETMKLGEHDPKHLLTKKIGVDYDPKATAPRWEKFLEEVLPDPDVRSYVQRAIGQTLLGRVADGVFFILHGDTGCGKSVFVKVMEAAFGEFGSTAAADTFRIRHNGADAPTTNMHMLRKARFVSTSESKIETQLDEELIKRVTGDDRATTRQLYQPPVTWQPEFTLWMATNFLPRLNAEDGAIWRRVKPIHFPNSFVNGERPREIGLADRLISEELAGIFNWVLAGVEAYRRFGLDDVEAISEARDAHRSESDTVGQFLAEDESVEVTGDIGDTVPQMTLFTKYNEWCKNNHIRSPLGLRRFARRLDSLGIGEKRTSAGKVRIGVVNRGWLRT